MPFNRRVLLRYGAAGTVAAATIAAASGLVVQGLSLAAEDMPKADSRDFDVIYKGKRIRGEHDRGGGGRHRVLINERRLSVMAVPMITAGGVATTGFVSAMNHYKPVPVDEHANRDGLLRLARLAVDSLGSNELSDRAVKHGH